jgi:hypothetical protein
MERVDLELETGLGGREGTPAIVAKTDGDVRYNLRKLLKVYIYLKSVNRGI